MGGCSGPGAGPSTHVELLTWALALAPVWPGYTQHVTQNGKVHTGTQHNGTMHVGVQRRTSPPPPRPPRTQVPTSRPLSAARAVEEHHVNRSCTATVYRASLYSWLYILGTHPSVLCTCLQQEEGWVV